MVAANSGFECCTFSIMTRTLAVSGVKSDGCSPSFESMTAVILKSIFNGAPGTMSGNCVGGNYVI